MTQKFSNGAKMTLALSCLAADTAITVASGSADLLPIANTSNWTTPLDWFRATIEDNTGAFEVVRVGTRGAGSAVLSVMQRGQEGTTARNWNAGAVLIHAPTAADFAQVLGGIFAQATISNGTAAAALSMVSNLLTISQSGVDGTLGAARFTFDQTTGIATAVDWGSTSDERLKSGWKGLGRHFLAKLADVKRGSYQRKGGKRREVGVSAQSLRQVLPQAVHVGPDDMLQVSYGPAALVAAIELAADNVQLRAAMVDLEARIKRLEGKRA